MLDLEKLFEKYHDEFIKFKRIENPPFPRPDLCAFLLLQEILPGDGDIITSAAHDQIWLDINTEELAAKATEDQIIYLIRCGVHYSDESLAMFV